MTDLTYSILTEDEWEHMGTGPTRRRGKSARRRKRRQQTTAPTTQGRLAASNRRLMQRRERVVRAGSEKPDPATPGSNLGYKPVKTRDLAPHGRPLQGGRWSPK
jgi:hypothetical protein